MTHTLQLTLLTLTGVAAAAGACLDMLRPPGPAGDDHGPAEGRSYGAVTRRPARQETYR